MARYFIQTIDADGQGAEFDGFDLPDDGAARSAALDALPDMLRETMPNGDDSSVEVTVRDAQGRIIYTATLALHGEWKR
ncbi:MAG: DUF6894 family protein [Bosea sp. (in: a-proteobacteria)]